MPKKTACPGEVKDLGANLVKARRMASDLAAQLIACYQKVDAAEDAMVKLGAKRMESGEGRELLLQAAACDGLIRQAHNSFRATLARCDVEEPSDSDIVSILGPVVSPRGGGGGGGRGGR